MKEGNVNSDSYDEVKEKKVEFYGYGVCHREDDEWKLTHILSKDGLDKDAVQLTWNECFNTVLDGQIVPIIQNLNNGNYYIEYDTGAHQNLAMIREWKDFDEANGKNFDEWVKDGKKSLKPKFTFLCRNIIVDIGDAFIVGFNLSNGVYVVSGNAVYRSKFTLQDLGETGKYGKYKTPLFYFVGGGFSPKELKLGGESFWLVDLNRKDKRLTGWDSFVKEETLWEKVSLEKKFPGPFDRLNSSDFNDNNPHDDGTPKDEEQFLKDFIRYVADCGFSYNDRDLIRFYTSVKCGEMTLVGGVPGCGKSSLVELFARFISGKEYSSDGLNSKRRTFARIDVNPAWMEPSDLMGYYSPILNEQQSKDGEVAKDGEIYANERYHPTSFDLKGFIEDKDRNVLGVVCFEEMNLARIELYFAEFLQIFSRNQRTLYVGRNMVEVPEDIRFVGTFNDDATTQRMSSRFLDRSNVISLVDNIGDNNVFSRPVGDPKECGRDSLSKDQFKEWIKNSDDTKVVEAAKVADEIYNAMIKLIKDKCDGKENSRALELAYVSMIKPSPRVRKGILLYMANRPEFGDGSDSLKRAFDEAFAQRVLSKCQPSPLLRNKYKVLSECIRSAFGLSVGGDDYNQAGQVSLNVIERLRSQSEQSTMWSDNEDAEDEA